MIHEVRLCSFSSRDWNSAYLADEVNAFITELREDDWIIDRMHVHQRLELVEGLELLFAFGTFHVRKRKPRASTSEGSMEGCS